MAIDRRSAMLLGAAAVAMPPWNLLRAKDNSHAKFASAARLADGRYAIVLLAQDGTPLHTIPLEGRGHDIAVSRDGSQAVAFARRPGRFAIAFNTDDTAPPVTFAPPVERHFYGHGVFSADNRLLYATENDFENARGVLGVYDIEAGYRRIGELSTFGVGPHDLLLLPDGKTLCVANGGIETHPAAGRAKLNISTMHPSLAFVDSGTGELLAKHETSAALHKLSIRHLCSDERGNVWFGGQWEGSIDEAPWLVGHASLDRPIRFSSAPDNLGIALKGYIGSVAASQDGSRIAVTAPRAGRTVFIDAVRETIVMEGTERDVCGVAPSGRSRFALTSGYGRFVVQTSNNSYASERTNSGIAFDNHLSLIER